MIDGVRFGQSGWYGRIMPATVRIRHIVASALLIACAAMPQFAFACSCAPRDIEALYRSADSVYFADVTLVQLVSKKATHNARATYAIELRPLRLFKGRDPGIQRATYTATYHDRSPERAAAEEVGRQFLINSCDKSYEIGQVVLIFKKRDVPLGRIGFCTPTFVSSPTVEHLQLLEKLSKS